MNPKLAINVKCHAESKYLFAYTEKNNWRHDTSTRPYDEVQRLEQEPYDCRVLMKYRVKRLRYAKRKVKQMARLVRKQQQVHKPKKPVQKKVRRSRRKAAKKANKKNILIQSKLSFARRKDKK